jgi:hypothetical protein
LGSDEINILLFRFQLWFADDILLLLFEFDHLAASSFKMAHQAYASSGSYLFFFEMLQEAYLFDAVVVFDNERIPISLVLGLFARQVVIA